MGKRTVMLGSQKTSQEAGLRLRDLLGKMRHVTARPLSEKALAEFSCDVIPRVCARVSGRPDVT